MSGHVALHVDTVIPNIPPVNGENTGRVVLTNPWADLRYNREGAERVCQNRSCRFGNIVFEVRSNDVYNNGLVSQSREGKNVVAYYATCIIRRVSVDPSTPVVVEFSTNTPRDLSQTPMAFDGAYFIAPGVPIRANIPSVYARMQARVNYGRGIYQGYQWSGLCPEEPRYLRSPFITGTQYQCNIDQGFRCGRLPRNILGQELSSELFLQTACTRNLTGLRQIYRVNPAETRNAAITFEDLY